MEFGRNVVGMGFCITKATISLKLVLRELKIRFGRFAKIRIRIRELKILEKRNMIFARIELRISDFFGRIKFVSTNLLLR